MEIILCIISFVFSAFVLIVAGKIIFYLAKKMMSPRNASLVTRILLFALLVILTVVSIAVFESSTVSLTNPQQSYGDFNSPWTLAFVMSGLAAIFTADKMIGLGR